MLKKSVAENGGEGDAFDHLFLAMIHHRIGEPGKAREHYERAVLWRNHHPNLRANWVVELKMLEAEALALLEKPPTELP